VGLVPSVCGLEGCEAVVCVLGPWEVVSSGLGMALVAPAETGEGAHEGCNFWGEVTVDTTVGPGDW
jgi:hypothetical protein